MGIIIVIWKARTIQRPPTLTSSKCHQLPIICIYERDIPFVTNQAESNLAAKERGWSIRDWPASGRPSMTFPFFFRGAISLWLRIKGDTDGSFLHFSFWGYSTKLEARETGDLKKQEDSKKKMLLTAYQLYLPSWICSSSSVPWQVPVKCRGAIRLIGTM